MESHTEEDTRIGADYHLIPYIIQAQHAWGEQHDKWHDQHMSMDGGDKPFDRTDLIELARDYADRDAFMDMVRGVIVRDDMIGLRWDVNQYGGSPGGSPYAETTIRRHKPSVIPGTYLDVDFDISFGLSEGDGWYVQYMYDSEIFFVELSWRDVSPTVIAHYVWQYIKRANEAAL